MVKKVHLSVEEIQQKIAKLQKQKDTDEVRGNKTKRKRLYHQLALLHKALQMPEQLVVDPEQVKLKQEADHAKRVQKKLQKKKQLIHTLKKEKRYVKRCLKCGSREHILADCPTSTVGFCFKCGSHDHSHYDCQKQSYALADCFYCGKKGHIARECELNEKGLYRKGGSCFGCGSVRHTLKECPVRNNARSNAGQFSNKEQF